MTHYNYKTHITNEWKKKTATEVDVYEEATHECEWKKRKKEAETRRMKRNEVAQHTQTRDRMRTLKQ